MFVCSLEFLLFFIAVMGLFYLARIRAWRQFVLAAANAAFLASLVPNLRTATWFAALLAGSYLLLLLVRFVRRGPVLAAAIVIATFAFLYVNRFELVADWIPIPSEWNLTLHPLHLVGLSYMFFKLVHMLVDERQEQLAPVSLWSYLNYQLSFFVLTAGPIQRYNDFRQRWEHMGGRTGDTREAVWLWQRILWGMFKTGASALWAHSVLPLVPAAESLMDPKSLLLSFYTYPFYLYLNFSGYTDVMIGTAGLLGFKLPENFNYPYLARNVLDFWARWHISLTNWIRDYVFMASYKVAATKSPETARISSYALLFLALFLAGFWHGHQYGYIAFGVLNGLGAAVTHGYGEGLRAFLGPQRFKAYLQNRTIQFVARLGTLHYVCFCHLFFLLNAVPPSKFLKALWQGMSALPAAVNYGLLRHPPMAVTAIVVLLLVGLWRAEAVAASWSRLTARLSERAAVFEGLTCALTVVVVLALFFDWAFQPSPPPVLYMSF
jgi:alginate O-acetyltransferase complex protein AlgI